LLPDLVN
jgi:hypothetical protein